MPLRICRLQEQRLHLSFGCGNSIGRDAEQVGQDGPGHCYSLPHDGAQGFLGEDHCCRVAAGAAGACCAAADAAVGFALGPVGDGQREAEKCRMPSGKLGA
jgi:hypothetical protein